MRSQWSLGLVLLLALTSRTGGLNIPLKVEQPPTIIMQTPSPVIALPLDDSFTMKCEAKGNPEPVYKWTKDDQAFDPRTFDSRIKNEENNGSFVMHNINLAVFQGKYRCYASNKLGTAISEEILLIVSSIPKFPKEKIEPIVVEEGQPVILECNPPEGIPPRQIYWMSIGLKHIAQDNRVSVGHNGNLYFSNALEKDSRNDYCCYAAFSAIRTIVQKTAMSVVVKNLKLDSDTDDSADAKATPERRPSLLTPSGVYSEISLIKGEKLLMECIAEGFPTPVVEWIKIRQKLPERANIQNFGKHLTISNVGEEDNGKYMCKARNSVGEIVHNFYVTVEEPPKWLPEPPKGQLAVIGSDVHIKCSATGKPRPAITWRRNGQLLDDDPSFQRRVFNDTIVLHKARPDDSAVYQCEASNRHGTILANANVMVMNMPPLMLTKNYQEYAVVQGGNILMDCAVFSSPSPTISWNKNDTAATVERERLSVSKNGSLQINNAEKEDSGEYVCFANNSEGKSAIIASLDVKDPTKIVELPQDLQIQNGTTAQLTCKAEYDKSLSRDFEIVWRKDGKEIPLTFTKHSRYFLDDGILQIISVNQHDQGTYTCIARTTLDEDTASATVTVLDVPDAPVDLVLSEYKSRSVHLTWVPGNDHNSSVTEFIVEYEESQWEPENWRELQRVPGNQVTGELTLHGHLDYQFRVYAVNAIGRGSPSKPTERYKTFPAAPDKNPENIKIQGHMPHQMDISWEPLLPVEHNGPGLEYKVSYRRLGVEDVWKEHLVKRHSFVVKNTPTFVPYEIKIQARNSHGWGPEPKVVTGYSGEDLPTAAPQDVAVEVVNTTLLRVSWTKVAQDTVRGHLGGYNVHWLRMRSLLHSDRIPEEKHSLSFLGNRSHAMVPDLRPFSEYRLTVNVFNKKGNGPNSNTVTFQTPEGVPEQVPILTASNAQTDSVTLVWGPPFEANGILTGYLLQYQLINETLDVVSDVQEVNVSGADTTQWVLQGLRESSLYRFYLSACTRVGCGPPVAQEGSTATQPHFSTTPAVAPSERIPALLNVSSYVSDTFAKISWTTREEQQDFQLYVAYMNNREGNWQMSEAVNTSTNFLVIKGLEPETVYTVRLMAKQWLYNASIFEDVIQTRVKGLAGLHGSISTQDWFIGTLCAVALLTLAVLIACFVRRNKGGKYAGTPPPPRPDMSSNNQVKEKEDLHPDEESQGMNDDSFCEYSDSDEKPLKGSQCSLDRGDSVTGDSPADSLADYGDEEDQFNEDGSFIGQYSDHKHRGSVGESNGPSPVIA